MSNQPVPINQSGALFRQSHDIEPARLPGKLQRAIDQEGAWGLVQAARAQAVAFVSEARIEAAELVTSRAMQGLDRLHRLEAALAKDDPIQAARYDSLVDDFMLVSRHTIRQLPREF